MLGASGPTPNVWMCLVSRWAWIGVGYLIGAIVFFHFVIIAAQKWLGPLNTSSAVLSEEALRARDIALYGQEGKGDLGDSVLDVDDEVQPHALRAAICHNVMFA